MADFKMVSTDADIEVVKRCRPIDWDVVIQGRPYYVVRVPGYVHTIGGRFGDNDYWAYPRSEEPTLSNILEFDADTIVCWGIRYEPKIYIKSKWDDTFARSTVSSVITRNGEDFCDVRGGVNRAIVMIDEINDHPLELNSIDFDKKMIGRKVWWRSEPGVITHYCKGQACVIIEPDGIEKFTTPAEFADEEFYYEDGYVKTSIFDDHIWWFRGDDN